MHRRSLIRACVGSLGLLFAACQEPHAPDLVPAEPSPTSSRDALLGGAYTAMDLGALGGNLSIAYAINPAGQVVGASWTAEGMEHAFLWKNGVMTDLGALGGTDRQSWAYGINPAGQVVGESETAGWQHRAVLWANGGMKDLGTLGGDFGGARAINPAGEVVGASTTAEGEERATLWSHGVITDLGTLGEMSRATAINAAGEVVGTSDAVADPNIYEAHAFIWAKGVMTDLGSLGGVWCEATGINSTGVVVGWGESANNEVHAFRWANGVMTDLGAGKAFGIGPAGQVVGYSEAFSPYGLVHAFLWTKGVMTDLGTMGGDVSWAEAINPAGQIVGASFSAEHPYEYHATLWTRKSAVAKREHSGSAHPGHSDRR